MSQDNRTALRVAGATQARPRAADELRRRRQAAAGDVHQATDRLHHWVFAHGQQYDSYLATEPGRELFWSSNDQGVISFRRIRRHVLVAGGLIAPEAQKRQLLEEFLDYAERLRWRPVFYCIREEDVACFRDAGFRVTKQGEDAIIDLSECTFTGKSYEWVRRQVNYCRRHGLVATEAGPTLQSPQDWEATLAEVLDVCVDSLADKPQSQELEFFDGRIGEHELGLRRLFVARRDGGRGRMEGFVVCNPMRGGAAWSTEIYRHRSDSVRGTVPFLFHHLILALQREGVEQVNLCLVPGRNIHTPLPGDNPLIRHTLLLAQKYLGVVFDMSGVDHFKSRFRPRYESRYMCTPPKPALGAFVANAQAFGLLRLDYRKTARLLWRRLRKRSARRSLSVGR